MHGQGNIRAETGDGSLEKTFETAVFTFAENVVVAFDPIIISLVAGGLLGDDAKVNEGDAIVAKQDNVAGVGVAVDIIGAHGSIKGFATDESDLLPNVRAGEIFHDVGDGLTVGGHTHGIGEGWAFNKILDDDVVG